MPNRVSAYLEQEILSASPVQVIHILYQAALSELREGKRNMAQNRFEEKCRNLTKASELIAELLSSLDLEAGGDLAVRLKALYEYMLSRLLIANLRNLVDPVDEIISLLSTLDEAWRELAAPSQPERPVLSGAAFASDMDAPAQVWSF